MTRRILPRAEYGRLVDTYLGPLAPHLPADADVVVIEDADGVIVACTSLYDRTHLECTWLAESARGNPRIVGQLVAGIKETAAARGAVRLVTAADTGLMVNLLYKLGAEMLPGTHWVWPVQES